MSKSWFIWPLNQVKLSKILYLIRLFDTLKLFGFRYISILHWNHYLFSYWLLEIRPRDTKGITCHASRVFCDFLRFHARRLQARTPDHVLRISEFSELIRNFRSEYEIEYRYDFRILIQLCSQSPHYSLLLTSWKRDYRHKIDVKCDNRKH